MKELILLAAAPIAVIVLVLGWVYLQSRRAKFVRINLSGLGITIDLQTAGAQAQGDISVMIEKGEA